MATIAITRPTAAEVPKIGCSTAKPRKPIVGEPLIRAEMAASEFSGNEARVFNKLVLNYALPAALFVSIIKANRAMRPLRRRRR